MNKIILCALAFVMLSGRTQAQDLSGQWQGIMHADKDLRAVVQISKMKSGSWNAALYIIDGSPEPIPVNSITVQGKAIEMSVDQIGGRYEGMLSADGESILGTWTQSKSSPLNLQHATKETAWIIDPFPHKVQFITVEKNVKLEVVDWGGSGPPLIFLGPWKYCSHIW